jgi:hypothetical protein
MADIEGYTDDQLHKALRSYGLIIPITPNSRKVCENKLKKLISESDKAKAKEYLPVSSNFYILIHSFRLNSAAKMTRDVTRQRSICL